MSPTAPSEADDVISRRAADYFQRRHFWEWTDADQAELDAWIAESFLHRAAYLRVKGIVAYTEHLAAVHTFKAGPWYGNGKAMRRWFALPLLAAASIALFAVLGFPFVSSLLQPPDRTYSTDIGGRAILKFAGGTQIELNTDTAVRFRMTGEERTVWLEKGEAWFHAAHDASRPFNVIVGKHRVTDLGTEFLVRRGSDGMEVTLLEGRAALSTEGAQTAMLSPGDEAVARPTSMLITRKTPQQLADELAWRRGVLVFRNTKLADVVREFNRYNTTKLVIADPAIAGVKISTDLKADDFESFVQLAEVALNLHTDREGNEILISRRTREETKTAAHAKRGP
jgi:transmembrane sensor